MAYTLVLSIFNGIVHGKGACRVGVKVYDWLFGIEKAEPSGQEWAFQILNSIPNVGAEHRVKRFLKVARKYSAAKLGSDAGNLDLFLRAPGNAYAQV